MTVRHVLGAPLAKHHRTAYAEGLVKFFGSPRAVNEYFVKSIDRLTNKAIGVMTADSVFAGLALFLSDRKPFGEIGLVALVLLLCAVGLCCSNLVATSSGISGAKLTDEDIMAHGLKVTMARTIRFTLSLYLSGAAFVLIITQVLIQLGVRMTH